MELAVCVTVLLLVAGTWLVYRVAVAAHEAKR
jgi:hypothetical protein